MPSIHIPNALPMGWAYLPTAISPCQNVAVVSSIYSEHRSYQESPLYGCFQSFHSYFINTLSRYTGGESDHHSHIFRDSNMGVGLGNSMGPAYHQGVHLYKLYVMLM